MAPVSLLDDRVRFPPPEEADESGLLCVGGDLRPERLLLAYTLGIFPWPEPGLPLLWHSPDPRCVLFPAELHVARSLRRTLARGRFEVRLDTACAAVIRQCSLAPRKGQRGTWITPGMRSAYCELARMGFVHSAEAWRDGRLVGGLYGVSVGACFTGESMFALEPNASKVAFVHLVQQLAAWGFHFIDCQVRTPHLARMGARDLPRAAFLGRLAAAATAPTRRGPWTLAGEPAAPAWSAPGPLAGSRLGGR